jgi:small subunit ribosomal protein S7
MNQQEHISEEAAKIEKIRGGSGPDLEMGTPVQEVRQWPRGTESEGT